MAQSSTVRSLVQHYAPESGAAAKQRILLELAQRLNIVVGEFAVGRPGLSGELALDLDDALLSRTSSWLTVVEGVALSSLRAGAASTFPRFSRSS